MCNFLSGISTKDKVFIDWRLDSHTDIIEHFELEKLDRMNGKYVGLNNDGEVELEECDYNDEDIRE